MFWTKHYSKTLFLLEAEFLSFCSIAYLFWENLILRLISQQLVEETVVILTNK